MSGAPDRIPAGSARSRGLVLVLFAAVVGLGLASRSGNPLVPGWLARNAGDALWTMALYLALSGLLPRMAPVHLLALALGGSLVVELGQLIRTEWLEQLRRTLPGRLVLGRGWQWLDLPRYAAGGLLALLLDHGILWPDRRDPG